MKTNDKTTATPSTTNTTNGIARNPPFVALKKPLSPYFAYGLIPGTSTFHSGMFTGVGLGLSSVPRKRARRTFENAERRSSQNLPSTRWADKLPVNTPNPSGWHHGCCCRTVDEERPARMTREGYLRGTAEYHAAISYASVHFEDQVAAGEKVVTRFIVQGTHYRGELMFGFPRLQGLVAEHGETQSTLQWKWAELSTRLG